MRQTVRVSVIKQQVEERSSTVVVVIIAPEKLITVWLGTYLEHEKIPLVCVGA